MQSSPPDQTRAADASHADGLLPPNDNLARANDSLTPPNNGLLPPNHNAPHSMQRKMGAGEAKTASKATQNEIRRKKYFVSSRR